MTKERYESLAAWLTARPVLLKLVKLQTRRLPLAMYIAYPLLLAVLAANRDGRLYRVLLVPAATFAFVTLLRKILNFPRPYEKLGITPLIRREGAGQSFPSRHAASAAVIAAAFLYVWPPVGIATTVIALLIAAVRPLAGIHFPRDVLAGCLVGFIMGAAGFWLIP